jgi:hypothetical protein
LGGVATLIVGSNKWEMNWSFDTVVEILCPLLLGFFPIVLSAMTLSVRFSCHSNNSTNKTGYDVDNASDFAVPVLVLCTVVFLGIQELMGSTKFKLCIRFRKSELRSLVPFVKFSLVTLGVSLLVLWTDRIVIEVTERSPFHKIGECPATEPPEDCDAEKILDAISFMFTPLTIEFCIFSVVKIIELLNEYRDHNDTVKNDDSEVTDSSSDSGMMQEQDNQPMKNSKRAIISTCVFFFGAIVLIAAFVVFIFNATNAREQAKKTSTVSTDYTRDSDYLITNAMTKTDESLSTAIDNYYKLRLIAHLLNGVCLLVLLFSTARAKLQKAEPRLMSSYTLMATGCAVVVFCGFSGFADVVCLANTTVCSSLNISNHKSLVLEVSDYSVNIFELFLQIFALMQVQRKRLKDCLRKRRYLWHLPGIYLYLALLNALLWGVDSFYEVKSSKERDLFDVQLFVYGEEHYNFIVQLLYPAAVYFRFHGAIIFARAFYEIVATDRLEVAHEQTLALDKVDNQNPDIAQLRRILSDLKSYWTSPKVEKVIKMTSKDLPKLDKFIAQLQDSVRKKTTDKRKKATEEREENERLELEKDLDKLGKKLKEYMVEFNENITVNHLETLQEEIQSFSKEVDEGSPEIQTLRRTVSNLQAYWLPRKVGTVIVVPDDELDNLKRKCQRLKVIIEDKTESNPGTEEDKKEWSNLEKNVDKLAEKLESYTPS